jgi:translation initiation factor IF-2
LPKASGAAVIGFNVRAHKEAREAAERAGVEIRYYNIIYDLVDDVKKAMSGLLAPEQRETHARQRADPRVFNVSKIGKVAGCRVTEGTVERGANVRLIRDNVVIHEGKLSHAQALQGRRARSARRPGMRHVVRNYEDIRQGDTIECYRVESIQRSL